MSSLMASTCILNDDQCWDARKATGNLGAHAPQCYEPDDLGRGLTPDPAATYADWGTGE